MILFIFQFILTNIIFSVIICAALIRLNKERIQSNLELLLYSLGMGPVFTSLLLYYLLLFIPQKSDLFYFLSVIIVYVALIFLGKKGFSVLWGDVILEAKKIKSSFNSLSSPKKNESILFSSFIVLLLVFFLFLCFPIILKTPITGSDALRYGNIGKILFKEKSLAYRWINPYPKTEYYFYTNHAPSFSLFLTWEKITGSILKKDNDLYYKSNTPYYALLLISLFLFWLSKKSKYIALLGVFTFLSGFAFTHSLMSNHLDFSRLFLLMVSWIHLSYSVEKKDPLSFLLLGIFSGLAAFVHNIGAVLVTVNCLVLFIFLKGNLKYKLSKTGCVIFLTIVFGWVHYIIDIIWGFGWIIFNRGITYWG